MFSPSLLSALLFALAVSANPIVTIRNAPVTLPISRHLNTTSVGNLYLHDFNRVQALKARGMDGAVKQLASTSAVRHGGYIASVGVGSPPTQYNLIVHTASSNTWVGANKAYVKTKSGIQASKNISAKYGSGKFTGALYTDTVTLGPGLVIKKQLIGVASSVEVLFQGEGILGIGPVGLTHSKGMYEADGILGIGPAALSEGTIDSAPERKIPTVTDNLFSTHMIPSNSVGISFKPTVAKSITNGELTWGGVDKSKLKGAITYVPITSTVPSKDFWGITQTITYGKSKTVILSSTAGIIDTATTLLFISSEAFVKYKKETQATHDASTKLLTLSSAGFSRLQSLYFKIGSTTFEFTANAQIWPRALNTAIGGTAGKVYLVVADIGYTGRGLDFVNGQVWLERFYTVYDTAKKRVGIANTPFTTAKTN